jgi:hypothetical protein
MGMLHSLYTCCVSGCDIAVHHLARKFSVSVVSRLTLRLCPSHRNNVDHCKNSGSSSAAAAARGDGGEADELAWGSYMAK